MRSPSFLEMAKFNSDVRPSSDSYSNVSMHDDDDVNMSELVED